MTLSEGRVLAGVGTVRGRRDFGVGDSRWGIPGGISGFGRASRMWKSLTKESTKLFRGLSGRNCCYGTRPPSPRGKPICDALLRSDIGFNGEQSPLSPLSACIATASDGFSGGDRLSGRVQVAHRFDRALSAGVGCQRRNGQEVGRLSEILCRLSPVKRKNRSRCLPTAKNRWVSEWSGRSLLVLNVRFDLELSLGRVGS